MKQNFKKLEQYLSKKKKNLYINSNNEIKLLHKCSLKLVIRQSSNLVD